MPTRLLHRAGVPALENSRRVLSMIINFYEKSKSNDHKKRDSDYFKLRYENDWNNDDLNREISKPDSINNVIKFYRKINNKKVNN